MVQADPCSGDTEGSVTVTFTAAPQTIGFSGYRIDLYDADDMSGYIDFKVVYSVCVTKCFFNFDVVCLLPLMTFSLTFMYYSLYND